MTSPPDNSDPGRRPIRFGVMCTGTTFRAWEARCLEKLLDLDFVEPGLLIIDARGGRSSVQWRKLKNLRKILWYAYNYVFGRRSRAMRRVDMTAALANAHSIRCVVSRKGRYSEYFTPSDVEEIRRHDLDFILRFGFNIIRGDILTAARHGVWSFHHDDEAVYRGSPPCFWEVYRGDPVTGAILQRLTDRLDAGVVLKKGFQKTIDTCYVGNRDAMFFESTNWPAQVCKDMRGGVAGYLDAPPSETSAPILYTPTNSEMIVFFLKVAWNLLRSLDAFVRFDSWNVGIVDKPVEALLREAGPPSVRWLSRPRPGTFRADSFAIRRGEAVHILFEDFDYATSRGCISALTVQAGEPERIVEHRGVISEPYHMAYPYLFEHDGEVYCIPETWEARQVALYRAADFPAVWTRVAVLIDDYAGVDSTVLWHDGRWWLFGTDQDEEPNGKLRVWHATGLAGPWHPHAANPVKVDPRSSRPAGRPFVCDGFLYRPAQDCSKSYGQRIIVNRVTTLTPLMFAEEEVGVVQADRGGPYPDGLHTVCGAGDLTIVDGMRKKLTLTSLPALRHKTRRVLAQMVGRRPRKMSPDPRTPA